MAGPRQVGLTRPHTRATAVGQVLPRTALRISRMAPGHVRRALTLGCLVATHLLTRQARQTVAVRHRMSRPDRQMLPRQTQRSLGGGHRAVGPGLLGCVLHRPRRRVLRQVVTGANRGAWGVAVPVAHGGVGAVLRRTARAGTARPVGRMPRPHRPGGATLRRVSQGRVAVLPGRTRHRPRRPWVGRGRAMLRVVLPRGRPAHRRVLRVRPTRWPRRERCANGWLRSGLRPSWLSSAERHRWAVGGMRFAHARRRPGDRAQLVRWLACRGGMGHRQAVLTQRCTRYLHRPNWAGRKYRTIDHRVGRGGWIGHKARAIRERPVPNRTLHRSGRQWRTIHDRPRTHIRRCGRRPRQGHRVIQREWFRLGLGGGRLFRLPTFFQRRRGGRRVISWLDRDRHRVADGPSRVADVRGGLLEAADARSDQIRGGVGSA